MSQAPLGLFDSGTGGLTVMREVAKRLPSEDIVYFADTARIPYGGKSKETIIRFSIENSIFLLEQSIKLLVVACNTATAFALQKLKELFKIPVIGVIEPGSEKACQVTRNGKIAVLGTKGTIASGAYKDTILSLSPHVHIVSIACPLFVPLVEERFIDHPAARLIVQEYLAPLKAEGVDTILLGCTHYPLLQKLIEEEMEGSAQIVDSASTCAEKVAQILQELNLQNLQKGGCYTYYASDDPHKFQLLGEEILGRRMEQVLLSAHPHH